MTLQGERHDVTIAADHDGSTVSFPDGQALRVTSDWTPGASLARLDVNGETLVLKAAKITGGFRIRTRGADIKVHVRTPRQAELALLMPEKLPPDTSKMLLCPMPGLSIPVRFRATVFSPTRPPTNCCKVSPQSLKPWPETFILPMMLKAWPGKLQRF